MRPGIVVADETGRWQVVVGLRRVEGITLGVVYASGVEESVLGRIVMVWPMSRPDFDRLRAVAAGHVRRVEGRFRDLSPGRHPLHRDVNGPVGMLAGLGLVVVAAGGTVELTVSGAALLELKPAVLV